MPSSRGSSQPRDRTQFLVSPALPGGFFTTSTNLETPGTIAETHNLVSLTFNSVQRARGGSGWLGLPSVLAVLPWQAVLRAWQFCEIKSKDIFSLASRAPPASPFPSSLFLVLSQSFLSYEQSGFLILSLKIHCLEFKPKALESDLSRWWTKKLPFSPIATLRKLETAWNNLPYGVSGNQPKIYGNLANTKPRKNHIQNSR